MIFFDSIDIITSSRLENLPWKIDGLRDINVFVGPNGCGKTTIMGALTEISKDPFYKKYHTEITYTRHPGIDGKIDFYTLFYKELVNPKYDFDEYSDSFFGMYDIMNNRKSAGQRSSNQIDDILKVQNSIIFIDEMDASLDWNGQIEFARKLKFLSKMNQVFVATHSMIVCSMIDNVYDVYNRKWITYDELKETYLQKVKL